MASYDLEDLDLENSKLILEGSKTKRDEWRRRVNRRAEALEGDKSERKQIYRVRKDFYVGDHSKYTNIVGLQKKEKKGHANAILNYAGQTVRKMSYSLSNNPPNMTYPVDPMYKPEDTDYESEEARTQAVEDFCELVLRLNSFTKKAYRRGVFNQSEIGDFAIKVYPINLGTEENPDWFIKIVNHEKMENLLVGWRGDDPKEFDFVIADELKSIQSIEDEWGIKIPLKNAYKSDDEDSTHKSSGHNNNQWGQKNVGLGGRPIAPSGSNTLPSVWVREYDDQDVYIIMICGQVVQYVEKDNQTFPKIKFWLLGENIPNPGSHWSISDIDYLVDPQIELNEGSNEERDYIRVGANQKYIAYNMGDFDPESVKTGSGGVIFVDSPDNTARFEPLSTNVNTYPADTFLTRMKKHIHDLGVPEVTFGSAGSDSGRSKAIDYQSLIDITVFKRDSWELVLTELSEKIQRFGFFYFGQEFFKDPQTNQFKFRYPEFDWSDIVPITQGDKIVNVLNKAQMGLPFKLVFKELGYKDVDAVINLMKKEAKDPELMEFRSKMYQLTPGILAAQAQASAMMSQVPPVATPNPNGVAQTPTLTTSQNQGRESSLPMATRGGAASFSTPAGVIERTQQNEQARG